MCEQLRSILNLNSDEIEDEKLFIQWGPKPTDVYNYPSIDLLANFIEIQVNPKRLNSL